MPSAALPTRIFVLCMTAFATASLISCAGKKPAAPHAAASKPKASPTPSAAATPTPAPTPEARYVARVSVEGGETTEQELKPANQPSPTPSASPSPAASPSPTPKPKPKNPLTAAWQKIFPAKVKATPTPTPTMTFRVSTEDGGQAEVPLGPAGNVQPTPEPAPTPIMLKARGESYFSRMWRKVFPKKATPPTAEPPQWIGVVKLVNEHEGYALVDAQNYATLPPGETLNAVGEDRETGVLRVTADREAPFFIADIVSGKPRAGDRIYSPKP
jgi:hypothetical protein